MRISSKVFVLTLSRLLNLSTTLLIGILLSRIFDRSVYGEYRQVWLVFRTLSPLLLLGFDSSVMFFLPTMRESEHKAFLVQTTGVLALLGLLLASIFFFGSESIASIYGNVAVAPLLRSFAIYPIFYLPTLAAPLWLVSVNRAVEAGILTSVFSVLRFAGTIAIAIAYKNLSYVFVFAGISAGLYFVVMEALIVKSYPGYSISVNWKLLKRQWRYSFPIGIAKVLSTIVKRVSQNVVAVAFTAERFAIFINGAFELPFVAPMTGAVMTVLVPEFVRLGQGGQKEKVLRLWLASLRKLAIFVFPVSVFFFVFSRETMVILFSSKYAESASIFRIFLLILPLRIAQYGAILRAMDKTSWILTTSVMASLITAGLGIGLVRPLDIYGPAIASVVGTYTMALVQLFLIARLLDVRVSQVFPWGEAGFVMATAIVAALPVYLLFARVLVDLPAFEALALGASLFFPVYFWLGRKFNVIKTEDAEVVKAIANRAYAMVRGE